MNSGQPTQRVDLDSRVVGQGEGSAESGRCSSLQQRIALIRFFGLLGKPGAGNLAEWPDVEGQVGEEGNELAHLGSIETADDERASRAGRGARLVSRGHAAVRPPGAECRRWRPR